MTTTEALAEIQRIAEEAREISEVVDGLKCEAASLDEVSPRLALTIKGGEDDFHRLMEKIRNIALCLEDEVKNKNPGRLKHTLHCGW